MPQKYPLPPSWRSKVVAAARALAIGKCEDRPNRGQIPDYVSRTAGGEVGLYWCMYYVVTVYIRAIRSACPLLKSGSCEQQRQRAIAKSALRSRAEFDAARRPDPVNVAGWIGLVIGKDDAGNDHAHHTFLVGDIDEGGNLIVTGPRGGWFTCEGNAADPNGAASSNGDGAYDGRERGHPDDASVYQFIDPEALAGA